MVCKHFLAPGHPWIRRHAAGLRRYRPLVVARRIYGEDRAPVPFEIVSLRHKSWVLGHVLRSRDVRLAHIHFLWNAIWFLRYWKKPGIPVVVTAHGSDVNNAYEDLEYGRQIRRVLTRIDAIVCVSRFIRDRVAGLGFPPERLIVNPLGVPLDRIDHFRRGPEQGSSAGLQLVSVAALREEKGHVYLIEAMKKVKSCVPGIKLVLAGDGPLRDKITKQILEARLEDSVRLLGWQTEEQVFRLLWESDIFVQPSVRSVVPGRYSREEGLPLGLAEAAAAGLPLVASRIGGIPEVCRQGFNGLLCEERDADGLASSILALVRDQGLRRELGERGRELARTEWDERTSVDRLETLYSGWIPEASSRCGAR